jgi:prepilin-type N-terminal cleavage/methylation domain-containing protein
MRFFNVGTRPSNSRSPRRSGYTLVEVLITVAILAIAAAMVIPSFGSTDVLRVQAGVRSIVADLTTAQSDALAYQRGRAVVFEPGTFPNGRSYRILEVRSTTLDPDLDSLSETRFTGDTFGDAAIIDGEFAHPNTIIFDEMGSPVDAPEGTNAAPNQWIDIRGSGQTYRITVEAYTGRITVSQI